MSQLSVFRKPASVPVDERTALQNAAIGILTGARSVTKTDAQRYGIWTSVTRSVDLFPRKICNISWNWEHFLRILNVRTMKFLQMQTSVHLSSFNSCFFFRLLYNFGSLKAIAEASEEQLALCPGLGPIRAKNLYNYLRTPFTTWFLGYGCCSGSAIFRCNSFSTFFLPVFFFQRFDHISQFSSLERHIIILSW